MAWRQEDNIDLSNYSTMRIGGVGKCLITTDHPEEDLLAIFQQALPEGAPYHILGEGSNTIFAGDFPDNFFIQLNNQHITYTEIDSHIVILQVDGGISWDDLVVYSVEHEFHGIEMMSVIPGTVAAAPVQNIGAYGGEFSDMCFAVDVFDVQEKKYSTLTKEDCAFGYRTSIFKEYPARYIVYRVHIKLYKKRLVSVPEYPGVAEYFDQKKITHPTLQDIREAITDIRWSKLPRPGELPNCGSFFKNAMTTQEHAQLLLATFPDMKVFPADTGMVKISTGWLIESQGLKGYRVGDMGIYEHHALIIVNHGNGTVAQLHQLIHHVQEVILKTFTISLEPEVNIITPPTPGIPA